MVLVAKVKKTQANILISYLREHDLFHPRFRVKKEADYLYYPVEKEFSLDGVTFIEMDENEFPQNQIQITLREALQDKLSEEELGLLKTSYDTVGTIAILEIDEVLRSKEMIIAQALLDSNPAIKTVLRKDGSHSGTFRSQQMKFLAGVETKIATHFENNTRMDVNVETVYFSPRLSNERKRIANDVKAGEIILVMFSGAGPYTTVLSKNTEAKHVVGVEINPDGHVYAEINKKKNKCKNVTNINADVHDAVADLKKNFGVFDRIIMPLPKTSDEFLDDALTLSKKGTILHFYDFLHEDDFDLANQKIIQACNKFDFHPNFLGVHTCGSQGVRTYRICVDVVLR